ncbi:hypothetical protein An07g05070 [Aspergillus niger]|uniref:Uncharacterized protein n=2 Tax=Aspergillus niger TaxID=5061 RepID=A2QNB7_ASPNC|nr:hypothetical protein An07g05070 [Aspergillus niger]CAK39426.1 hypothetical protein An07g05070 [Aspergillus niger]
MARDPVAEDRGERGKVWGEKQGVAGVAIGRVPGPLKLGNSNGAGIRKRILRDGRALMRPVWFSSSRRRYGKEETLTLPAGGAATGLCVRVRCRSLAITPLLGGCDLLLIT